MLDDSDISFDDLLIHIILCRIILNRIKLWLRPYMVDGFIKQVALGRADFTHRPVISAYIILGRELTVFIGGIGVNQFLAFVDAVNCTCKGSIALRCAACSHIGLSHGHIELFKDVGKTAICDLVPFNRGCLGIGNDIADCRIHFLKHIRGIAADKDILKLCHALCIGHGILIHRQTA